MLKVFPNPEVLLQSLADEIVAQAKAAIEKKGRFTFALSGGSSPKKLYELLASDAYRSKIEWTKVFFFFGDERYVPLDDAQSNYLMAKLALFDKLSIPSQNIYPVNTALSPEDAAASYEKNIRELFKNDPIQFDFVLLGLGDDTHTASLFPRTTVLHETKALIKDIYIDKVKMFRVTFTAPLINASQHVAFLVYGAGKADAIHQVIKGPKNIEEHPAQLIAPTEGGVVWYLDEGAAAKVK